METKRIRRVRVTATETRPKKTKQQMLALLQSIAKMQQTMAQLQKNLNPLVEQLEIDMIDTGILVLTGVEATAEITQSSGKKQVIVDPRKLYSKVDENDFFECVTVGVTKAKSILGEKELARISTTIPGKLGPKKLTIKLA